MSLCETVSIVMASHYAEHIHFWQENKSLAFIFTPFIFIFLMRVLSVSEWSFVHIHPDDLLVLSSHLSSVLRLNGLLCSL